MQIHGPVNAAQPFVVDTLAAIAQAIVAAPEADSRMLLCEYIQLILHRSIILWLRRVGTGGSWQLHEFTGLPVAALSFLFKESDSVSFNGRPYHFFASRALAASSWKLTSAYMRLN